MGRGESSWPALEPEHPAALVVTAALRELLSGVVHELRNSLFALGAMREMLEERAGIAAIAPHLELLRAELLRLGALGDDLDALAAPFSKASRAAVAPALEGAARELSSLASSRGVSLSLHIAPALGEVGLAEARLFELFARVLGFCVCRVFAGGSVTVRAQRRYGAKPKVAILVHDTGKELAAEELAHALLPFALRRDGRRSLDLAIAASLARRCGGKLRLACDRGAGLRVTIELPRLEVSS